MLHSRNKAFVGINATVSGHHPLLSIFLSTAIVWTLNCAIEIDLWIGGQDSIKITEQL